MPRIAKTDEERKRQGSRGYGTKFKGLLKLSPLTIVPPPPKWLKNVDAQELWKDLCPVMIEHKVLNRANIEVFAVICGMYGQLRMQYEAIERFDPKTLMAFYRFVSDFGMTPAAMIKAQISTGDPAQPVEEANPFLKNKSPTLKKAA